MNLISFNKLQRFALTSEMDKQRGRIKTYSRRESRITPAQQRALAVLLDSYQLPYSDSKINLSKEFPGTEKFAIEVGFGDGESLVQQALENKNTAYLGIEVYRPGVGKCLMQLSDNNVTNVRISTADARDVISNQIHSNCVNEFMILFPDPWPKARHHKRRLINSEFIDLCADRLIERGLITIKTDSSNYADQVVDVLEANTQLECIAPDSCLSNRPQTRYENKAMRAGNTVYEMRYARLTPELVHRS